MATFAITFTHGTTGEVSIERHTFKSRQKARRQLLGMYESADANGYQTRLVSEDELTIDPDAVGHTHGTYRIVELPSSVPGRKRTPAQTA